MPAWGGHRKQTASWRLEWSIVRRALRRMQRHEWPVMSFSDQEMEKGHSLHMRPTRHPATSYAPNLIFPIVQTRVPCWSLTQPSHWTTSVPFLLLLSSFLLLCFPAWCTLHDVLHPSDQTTRPSSLQPHRCPLRCDRPHNLAFDCSPALCLCYFLCAHLLSPAGKGVLNRIVET